MGNDGTLLVQLFWFLERNTKALTTMTKKLFISTLLFAGFLAGQSTLAADSGTMQINGVRLNEQLQTFGKLSAEVSKSTSRLAYSDTDIAGRKYIVARMRAAGLATEIDAAGNIIGKRAGQNPSLPVIMLGSHSDSVPAGGLYDGPVGVFGAIEVAQTLQDQNHLTRHPLEIVVFQNEESGKTGSRLMTSGIMLKEFELVSASGKTIAQGIRALDGNPDPLLRSWNCISNKAQHWMTKMSRLVSWKALLVSNAGI